MSDIAVPVTIDTDKCLGCGQCMVVCSHATIALSEGKARITGSSCSQCGHCRAACPEAAIQVTPLEPDATRFNTFTAPQEWLPYGAYDTVALANLIQSRRSCRNFKSRSVPGNILEDLIKLGAYAPSGTNCQPWIFTIFPHRGALEALGSAIARFYHRLNKLAANPLIRLGLKTMGKPALADYYADYYDQVHDALYRWESEGVDMLFHGAQAGILVSADQRASCPAEDALLATQNILLAAHSMGLGTCLIGYAISAMQNDRRLRTCVKLKANEMPYAFIALGYGDETYRWIGSRKTSVVRYFQS